MSAPFPQWNASRIPLASLQKGFTRPWRYASSLSYLIPYFSQNQQFSFSYTNAVVLHEEDFTSELTAVSHCDVLTGSRDQGHDPDPHHGDPLRGGHVGHQTGVCENVRQVAVHCHLSKSQYNDNSTSSALSWDAFLRIQFDFGLVFPGWHLRGLQEATVEAVWRKRLKARENAPSLGQPICPHWKMLKDLIPPQMHVVKDSFPISTNHYPFYIFVNDVIFFFATVADWSRWLQNSKYILIYIF